MNRTRRMLAFLCSGLLVAACSASESSEEDEPVAGNVGIGGSAYCPSSASAPTPTSATYCYAVPSGDKAPIRWWSYSATYIAAACKSTSDVDSDFAGSLIGLNNSIVLPHDSEYLGDVGSTCYTCSSGAWGHAPEFKDLKTGKNFHFNHIRPASDPFNHTADVGKKFGAGTFVGIQGADTCETGYCTGSPGTCTTESGLKNQSCTIQHSTGAHLCVVTPDAVATDFPKSDPLPTCTPSATSGPTCPSGAGWAGAGAYCDGSGIVGGVANELYTCAAAGGPATPKQDCASNGGYCFQAKAGTADYCASPDAGADASATDASTSDTGAPPSQNQDASSPVPPPTTDGPGGCAASPHGPDSSSEGLAGVAIALAAVVKRARRRRG